jgi:hypothetical protein
VAAAAEDAAPFALGGTAPDAVVDPVGEGVLEARFLDGAVGADLAGLLDADAVGGEEIGGRPASAPGLEHPLMVLVVGGGRLGEVEIHRAHRFKRQGAHSGSRKAQASCGGGDESNMTTVSGTFYGSGGV